MRSCVLTVTSTTWERNKHGLFDYEAQNVNSEQFRTNDQRFKMIRQGADVFALAENQSVPPSADYLLRVHREDGQYHVCPPEKGPDGSTPGRLWMVARDLSTRGHDLHEDDVLKLGRCELRVRQCVRHDHGGDVEAALHSGESEVLEADDQSSPELQSAACKICMLEGSSDDDPLIAPCACNGSIRYVHLNCLRTWIRGRLDLQPAERGSYFCRQLQCELCNASYPAVVQRRASAAADGAAAAPPARTRLAPMPRTRAPFVVLEATGGAHGRFGAHRGLHVLSLARGRRAELGRSHQSDARVFDVSISRLHAMIQYHKGRFVLRDQDSKFGTLVAINAPHAVDEASPLSVQVGRSVLRFSVDQPRSARLTRKRKAEQEAQGPSSRSPPLERSFDEFDEVDERDKFSRLG